MKELIFGVIVLIFIVCLFFALRGAKEVDESDETF